MTPVLVVLGVMVVGSFALGLLGVWLCFRRQRQHGDEVLLIKPPRRFVDADGRSDFRPELRERAASRRGER